MVAISTLRTVLERMRNNCLAWSKERLAKRVESAVRDPFLHFVPATNPIDTCGTWAGTHSGVDCSTRSFF